MENKMPGKLVLKQADAFPESFAMNTRACETAACGTVACLAGHALLLSGYTFRLDRYDEIVFTSPDGEEFADDEIGNEAQRVLGISLDERIPADNSGDLFYLKNSQEALARFGRMLGD